MKNSAKKNHSKDPDGVFPNVKATHRWGYKDTKFTLKDDENVFVTGNRYSISGYDMPGLVKFSTDILKYPFSNKKRKEVETKLPPSKRNEKFITRVQRKYKAQLKFDDKLRLIHSHGQTTADEVMKVLYLGHLDRYADAVFYSLNEKDVSYIVKAANETNVCLVPFGGGTSVSSSLTLPADEKRMIVVVDTTSLSKVISLDKENRYVTVEAGITGLDLESHLQAQGYTTGHEPDSIEFSTVGGWISTNASGMKKNRYGNIEEIVDSFTIVTPAGTLETIKAFPRTSSGIKFTQALLGSEGNLGIITKATLKIRKLPELQKYQSLIFADFKTGIDFLRELKDYHSLPASIRLMDNKQFHFGQALKEKPTFLKKLLNRIQYFVLEKIKGFDFNKISVATVMFEGKKQEVNAQQKIIRALVKKYGGLLGGATNGKLGYSLTYAIAYIRDFFLDHYVLGETYETTVLWKDIEKVCAAVEKKAQELHAQNKFPGVSFVAARITQIYPTGVCIYFTHGVNFANVKNPEDKFSKLEKKLREEILRTGGSISHHHGIGKLRAKFVSSVYTNTERDILLQLKKNLDPKNIFGIRNNVFYQKK